MDALRVGLVGAGPWAAMVHAPVLAAGPETQLEVVWARRPEAAAELAGKFGAAPAASFDEMLDRCEAVAFCVPPTVQAELAPLAAKAGKGLLLEKPLAGDLDSAERVAAAVEEAGVGSLLVLTYRYGEGVRRFVDEATNFDATGARATFISGALLGGPFAMGWRMERGALLDVGPHVIDLVSACLGPVTRVQAHGEPMGWIGLLLDHEGGAVSEVSLSATVAIDPSRTELELYGPKGALTLDARAAIGPEAFATLRKEFAETTKAKGGHPLDATHGLELQRILDQAERALTQ